MFGSALRVAMANKPVPPPPFANPKNFSDVKLLIMNGNGTEGNTDMTDMSLSPRPVSYIGQAQMDTGIVKFPDVPTLLMDGVTDGLDLDDADIGLASNDWTIEFWMNPDDTVGNQTVIRKWDGAIGQRGFSIFRLPGADQRFQFEFSSNGSTTALAMPSASKVLSNLWTYGAVQREGNLFSLWFNSLREKQATNSLSISNGGIAELRVGNRSTSEDEWDGNLGPIRMTIGEAIFTNSPLNIVVPTGPWPVDVLELENVNDRMQLEGSVDNILLEDSSGVLALEGTGDALTLEDGSGRLALD
ncbi:hypothetical protein LCGC14_1599840 [marine sediment metagenome]|uniref:LamG-like jellyroll fold domain-containing protein n=1 Tax=marine sediment metagenome TaxID=412755 RepID=A0A0F9IBU0_9ZZZZ